MKPLVFVVALLGATLSVQAGEMSVWGANGSYQGYANDGSVYSLDGRYWGRVNSDAFFDNYGHYRGYVVGDSIYLFR
jgi:hypothetical protein